MHLQDGDHVPKLAIEPTKKCKNHSLLTIRISKLPKGSGHRLKAMTVVCDRECDLPEVAKFGFEDEGTRFTLLEELILKEEPRQSGRGPAEHHRLLKIM
jgi:hypothetical protein